MWIPYSVREGLPFAGEVEVWGSNLKEWNSILEKENLRMELTLFVPKKYIQLPCLHLK